MPSIHNPEVWVVIACLIILGKLLRRGGESKDD